MSGTKVLRLREQYNVDRKRDSEPHFMRNKPSHYRTYSFEECARSVGCRSLYIHSLSHTHSRAHTHAHTNTHTHKHTNTYQFARWGNIQTRYLCGWGGPADADGNLTYIKVTKP